ncbi:dihydrofolate reductase family protein [Algoriphagus zhangzhouensis]|uniref:Dihydrofolate reductase n=1 Tax=Algoriphagus zhangzhouensis TaxID=1073327 RepID=A0A1M7Z406_9BACT|nr:dihydrofolate reductase family protein [Algoriphagus zhangzhouensis]TDY48494.1 dihydrofolate reductase [Algoriphagus zhangzhouensis]SHO59542.1 Dihydrofolate reductase [Algoriphagus zhangzhouensis]
MEFKNSVFIATSLDGFIADKNGEIEWLTSIPNPDQNDMGYHAFMDSIDALVMGRVTYETVLGFGGEWPYSKPVFVLSNTLESIPDYLNEKVFLIHGNPKEILETIHSKGLNRLYIDGGKTIQSFMKEGLINELIITTITILLGSGFSLFGDLNIPIHFELKSSKVYLNQYVQNHFVKS